MHQFKIERCVVNINDTMGNAPSSRFQRMEYREPSNEERVAIVCILGRKYLVAPSIEKLVYDRRIINHCPQSAGFTILPRGKNALVDSGSWIYVSLPYRKIFWAKKTGDLIWFQINGSPIPVGGTVTLGGLRATLSELDKIRSQQEVIDYVESKISDRQFESTDDLELKLLGLTISANRHVIKMWHNNLGKPKKAYLILKKIPGCAILASKGDPTLLWKKLDLPGYEWLHIYCPETAEELEMHEKLSSSPPPYTK